jgi:hypothetical protein
MRSLVNLNGYSRGNKWTHLVVSLICNRVFFTPIEAGCSNQKSAIAKKFHSISCPLSNVNQTDHECILSTWFIFGVRSAWWVAMTRLSIGEIELNIVRAFKYANGFSIKSLWCSEQIRMCLRLLPEWCSLEHLLDEKRQYSA